MQQILVHSLFSAIDSSNWSALEELLHEDVVYDRPGYAAFEGKSRVLDFYRNERIIARGEHILERVVAQDDCIAAWGTFIGVAKNGLPLNERFADVYELKHEKIYRRRSYFFRAAI